MTCPSCKQRSARRACPALGQEICPICCGTKRLKEIRCPETCGYLAAARHHPAAAVQRQTERDFAALGSSFAGLTESQQQLCVLLLGVVAAHGAAETLDRVTDEDVAAAAAALARTFETASRGVIYEHRPQSGPAQRLGVAIRELLGELEKAGARGLDRDAAVVLRAVERGIPNAHRVLGAEPRTYIELVRRVIRTDASRAPAGKAPPAGGLILPG